MSQHDMDVANASGANFRADVNLALQALVSNSSGNSAPSTTYAFQLWVDSSLTPNILKIRNAANNGWISIGRVDREAFGLNYFFSGNSEPTTTQAFMPWVDTNLSYPVYKIRNAANDAWITIGRLDVNNYGLLPLTGGTLSGAVSFSNTDHITLPKGTTAQRTGSPGDGMIRFNTTTNVFEGYKNGAWGELGGGGFVVSPTQTVSSGGDITTTTTDQRQQRPVVGNAAPTSASVTPFGSAGGWKNGTEVLLIGTDDANPVILSFNDAAKGLVGNFSEIELGKYATVLCVYNSTLDRWIVQGGR